MNSNIDADEIIYAVKKIKSGRAPGIERVPIEFVKETIDIVKDDLVLLFNYILASEKYPTKWCEGLRVAIPKSSTEVRPITIEPIFAKIFETILDYRVTFVNEAYDRIDKFNGGFLKGSQTQDNLFILNSIINKQLCINKPLYLAYIDFKKAFNFVQHKMLFYKLLSQGITGRFINILKDMYSKLGAHIKIGNNLYGWIKDQCGTNQGGPLSPSMFRVILSDLCNYLDPQYGVVMEDQVFVHLLWADDLVIMAESTEGLQRQLDG